MASYYTSSANQREIMQNPYLGDHGHGPYMESSLHGNIVYPNYSSSSPYSDTLEKTQTHQNNPTDNSRLHGSALERSGITNSVVNDPYNTWRGGGNEMFFMQSGNGSIDSTEELVRSSVADDQQIDWQTQLSILNGQNLSTQQSSGDAAQGQELSLTLSTQVPVPPFHYQPAISDVSLVGAYRSNSGNLAAYREDYSSESHAHLQPSNRGPSSFSSRVSNSKYLKAAKELLDEVINVQNALKNKSDKNLKHPTAAGNVILEENNGSHGIKKTEEMPANPQESTPNSTSELSPSEKQDLQNKMTKLLVMMDEVSRKYKQYYNQMQIVVSSFDMIAGKGVAKPYTALALQTISKHFRRLKDAISGQISATRKRLGENDDADKGCGIPRLRYIDQHLRQQRAFQQFGVQQYSWRPQRGLPENSVTVLRAWLFEHFLHPYPKDSEKLMLSRQTGLTRSQVSNWFINARVRLWKPMIEEMYKEENGDIEMDSNTSSESASKGSGEVRSASEMDDLHSIKSLAELSHSESSNFTDSSKSNILPGMKIDGKEDANFMNPKPREQNPTSDDNSLLQHTIFQSDDTGRLLACQVAELGGYGNHGVSLTLGLQYCEDPLVMSDDQHNFLQMRGGALYHTVPLLGPDTADYNHMNLADGRERFGKSQLLHDFVV